MNSPGDAPPKAGRPRPGRGEAAIPTPSKIDTRVTEAADTWLGCASCGVLGFDQRQAAADLGLYCSETRCAALILRGLEVAA